METPLTPIQQLLQNLSSPSLFLPLLLFLIFIYKHLFKNTSNNKNFPPSPPKLPILGNLHQVGKFPHRSLHTLSTPLGDLMLLHLGSKPTLVVSSANAAKEIMKTHDIIFANRPKSRIMCRVIYDGKDIVFAPYGEFWRRIKSICVLQLLSTKKVRSFRSIREEESHLTVKKIEKTMPLAVNLSDVIVTLSSNVLCRTAFGRKYTGEDGGVNFKQLLDEFVEVMGALSMADFVPWLGWVDWVSGLTHKVEKVAQRFDDFLEKVVQEHLDCQGKVKGGDCEGLKRKHDKDFVDILLDIQKVNKDALPNDSIKAIVLDMFAAGTDTTYTLLEWAMTELLRHPQAMKLLQDEIRGIVKGKQIVEEDDLENLKYSKMVIKETLRLHPPLPILLFRETYQDVKVNGYDIAANTQVIVNAWAIQRDVAYWEQPDEFLPERFLNLSIDYKGLDFQFIPFGAGRRGCPGIAFAMVNAELVLANFVYKFDWKLPNGVECEAVDLPENAGVTVRRRDPLIAIATSYSCN